MSRTYRRKNYPVSKHKTHDWVYDKETGVWYRIPYEDKELAKNLARHYSDAGYGDHLYHNPSKWFRKNEEKQQRMYNRCELERFYKNFDYEVMAEAKKKLPYWD